MPILAQWETRIGDAAIMFVMRVLAVYFTLLILLTVSVAAGYFASNWPQWCHSLNWCDAGWPQQR